MPLAAAVKDSGGGAGSAAGLVGVATGSGLEGAAMGSGGGGLGGGEASAYTCIHGAVVGTVGRFSQHVARVADLARRAHVAPVRIAALGQELAERLHMPRGAPVGGRWEGWMEPGRMEHAVWKHDAHMHSTCTCTCTYVTRLCMGMSCESTPRLPRSWPARRWR